ncbi:MAG: MFS transporter [Planctomycetes bacterium]|nr:MFS transporter [Planctomycetota bacterium]
MLRVVLDNPLFARLWAAQVISQAGDWLNRVAVIVLIGTLGGHEHLTGIGVLFGAELVLRLLPSAFLGPIAGPIADRLPRRLLMVTADLVRAGIVACLCFVREPEHLVWLYAGVGAQMGVAIFFDASRAGALPSTVARKDLHAAHTLSAATWSMMLGIGALTGGILVDRLGVQAVFVIDAVTYLASAACLFGLKLVPTPVPNEPLRWRDLVLLADLRRGLAHVRQLGITPMLWAKTFWGAAGGYLVILALAGHQRFGASESDETGSGAALATGVLYAARGVGTGLGPILSRRWIGETDAALKLQTSLGFVVAAFGYTLFGFAHDLYVAALWVAVAHLGGSTLWIASTVYWQRHVADEFRGRVFAIEFLGMDLAFASGGLFAGLLFDATGSLAVTVWVVSGLVAFLGAVWTWRARGMQPRAQGAEPTSSSAAVVPHEEIEP